MKLASLVLASIASPLSLALAHLAPSNASTPLVVAASNSSREGTSRICSPSGGVTGWYYNSWSNGPHTCYGEGSNSWTMRSAYRSGGTEDLHWKYTDIEHDTTCLKGWEWYEEDGVKIKTVVRGYAIRERATGRLWCPLPVYRSGGLQDRQWQWCTCS